MNVSAHLIETILSRWSDRTLIESPDSSLSFSRFFQKASLLSEKLETEPGDRVFLKSKDQVSLMVALWALWMRKSIAVPVNPSFPENRIWSLMSSCGSRFILVSEDDFQEVPSEIKVSLPDSIPEKQTGIQKNTFRTVHPYQAAAIIFTSGSSGKPKGAVLSLANFCYSALGANQQMSLVPGDRWLLSLPLFHVGGLGILFRCLLSGATVVIPDSNQNWQNQLHQLAITHLSVVPTQLFRMMENDEEQFLKSMKMILLGGAAQSHGLIERAQRFGLPLRTSYGSTEMCSQVATSQPKKIQDTWTACGKVLPYREVKLAEDGEILVRGQSRFLGYLENDKGSNQSKALTLNQPFDDEGWFASGDLGEWIENPGEEPLLKMTGRKDSMFISGGENIQPQEIEERLSEIPGIEQSIVVPVQDPEFGNRPVAFLKINTSQDSPAKENLNEVSLIRLLKRTLAPFQIPDLFLPLDLNNNQLKPQRKELCLQAQPVFDEWRKIKPLRHWLREKQTGWKKILTLDGFQVFKVIRLEEKKASFLFVCANSRQEIMEKISGDFFKNFGPEIWKEMRFSNPEEAGKETFQIIRMLEDDLEDGKILVLRDMDQALTEEIDKASLQNDFTVYPWEIVNTSGKIAVREKTYEYGFCAPEFSTIPEIDFEQAVFQSGVWLPEWERFYLIRCLYSSTNQKNRFLGWKVQLLKDIGNGKELSHPIWAMNEIEEEVLETVLMDKRIFSKEDLEQANTPAIDRLRRKNFVKQR
ncbi:MAG: o-succinylbenzoate--CoA ligase [bacterium]